MNRLSKIIDLLQKEGFEISKDLQNTTITVSNAIPILSFPASNVTTATNFELRAKHESRDSNEKALQEIYKLLEEDSSFVKKNLDEYDSDIDIFHVSYKAPKCL